MGPARVSAPGPTPPAGYRLLGKTGRLEGRDPLTRTLSVPRPLASVCPWPPCFSALCREPSKYGIDAHLPKKLEDAGKYCMNATGLRGWGRPAVERGGGPESCSLEEPGHPKMGEASPYRQAQVSREPGTPVLGGVQRPPPPHQLLRTPLCSSDHLSGGLTAPACILASGPKLNHVATMDSCRCVPSRSPRRAFSPGKPTFYSNLI